MPSLRRTVSTPLVRTSPYPSSLSASAAQVNAINGGAGSTATRPRRCTSGSDTIRRRVLADIEWWRVLDGQQPEEPELDEEQEQLVESIVNDIVQQEDAINAEALASGQLLLASGPVSEVNADGDFEVGISHRLSTRSSHSDAKFLRFPSFRVQASSLATPFAALRISATSTPPLSPSRPRREASDASDMSFESVDSFDFEPTPISSPVDVFMDTVSPFAAFDGLNAPLQSKEDEKRGLGLGRPPLHDGCLQMGRSLSFGGFPSTSFFEDEDRFSDVVFL
ncbi:hypothetical protein SCHPADRAFT_993503 [Schizopora paradoxa]|uniref:Uncharacterized protein n=1 Tax=Schizopora paradoxa TaxID=27342 RepID=A0A0H2SA89_9AGAM|nr:hypothetical protein SCHPADRAFT_993503 [Schizopora paradoxa]